MLKRRIYFLLYLCLIVLFFFFLVRNNIVLCAHYVYKFFPVSVTGTNDEFVVDSIAKALTKWIPRLSEEEAYSIMKEYPGNLKLELANNSAEAFKNHLIKYYYTRKKTQALLPTEESKVDVVAPDLPLTWSEWYQSLIDWLLDFLSRILSF